MTRRIGLLGATREGKTQVVVEVNGKSLGEEWSREATEGGGSSGYGDTHKESSSLTLM